jgi:hypothetical protein
VFHKFELCLTRRLWQQRQSTTNKLHSPGNFHPVVIVVAHSNYEGLNVVENWNATNDFICYGRQGELATNRREQQEIVTLSLQLLQNCLMLINTLLIERTLEREDLWERLTAADFRGLTPLFYGHINPYGQFALDLARPSFLEAA